MNVELGIGVGHNVSFLGHLKVSPFGPTGRNKNHPNHLATKRLALQATYQHPTKPILKIPIILKKSWLRQSDQPPPEAKEKPLNPNSDNCNKQSPNKPILKIPIILKKSWFRQLSINPFLKGSQRIPDRRNLNTQHLQINHRTCKSFNTTISQKRSINNLNVNIKQRKRY